MDKAWVAVPSWPFIVDSGDKAADGDGIFIKYARRDDSFEWFDTYGDLLFS